MSNSMKLLVALLAILVVTLLVFAVSAFVMWDTQWPATVKPADRAFAASIWGIACFAATAWAFAPSTK